MSDTKTIDRKISRACNSLKRESVEQIDFDELQELLIELKSISEKHHHEKTELTFLKKEYCGRIIGMLKANLTCRNNDEDNEIVLRLSRDLDEIKTGELVKLYTKTAARLRTNFPASFRHLRFPSSPANSKNWDEHKI